MRHQPAALRRNMPTGWQGPRGEPAFRSDPWGWKPIRINMTIQLSDPLTVNYETLASWTRECIDFNPKSFFSLNVIYIPRTWILFIWDNTRRRRSTIIDAQNFSCKSWLGQKLFWCFLLFKGFPMRKQVWSKTWWMCWPFLLILLWWHRSKLDWEENETGSWHEKFYIVK